MKAKITIALVLLASICAFAWMNSKTRQPIAAPSLDIQASSADQAAGVGKTPSRAPSASTLAETIEGGRAFVATRGESDYQDGKAELLQGHVAEAVRLLESAVKGDPKHAEAWMELSFAYLKRRVDGDMKRVRDAAQRSLDLDPKQIPAWYNLAAGHAGDGNKDAAFIALTQASRLDPPLVAKTAEADPDLDALRSDPRFRAILEAR